MQHTDLIRGDAALNAPNPLSLFLPLLDCKNQTMPPTVTAGKDTDVSPDLTESTCSSPPYQHVFKPQGKPIIKNA